MKNKSLKPFIGQLCTWTIWSDTRGGKITEISKSGKRITMELTEGGTYHFSLRLNGRWKMVGSPMRESGNYCSLGHARDYYDPSF